MYVYMYRYITSPSIVAITASDPDNRNYIFDYKDEV